MVATLGASAASGVLKFKGAKPLQPMGFFCLCRLYSFALGGFQKTAEDNQMIGIPNTRKRFKIVHELPKRIRLKSLVLLAPDLDHNYLQASVESLNGVESVRINGPAFSIAVEYNGTPEVRSAIIETLDDIPQEAFLKNNEREHNVDLIDVAHGRSSCGDTFLPLPVQAATSWMLGIPGIVKGLETFLPAESN